VIRARLHDLGIEINTLLFFISDNGAPLKTGAWNGSLNKPLVGEKGMLTDAASAPRSLPRGPERCPPAKPMSRPSSASMWPPPRWRLPACPTITSWTA